MHPSASHFIGYGRLEDLLEAHTDLAQPLYVELLIRRIPGDPIGWAQQTILVQDFDQEERVRYCRLPCGGYDLIHGEAFSPEKAQQVREFANQRHTAVLEYLKAQGFKMERATVAMPKELVFLDGTAGFLDLDKRN
jgi:hypothetical protein